MKINLHRIYIFCQISSLFLFSILLLGLTFSSASMAEPQFSELKLNNAINRAGLQRMLTQRMLKSYSQLGQDQFYIKPEKKLQDAVAHYEQGLNFLKDFEQVEGVKSSLQKISAIWPPYKNMILGDATKGKLPELLKMNEKLLALSHQIVVDLERLSGKELGKVVNISGRQRMLSQRIELFYLLRNWGFTDPYYLEQLAKARKQFTEGLEYLNHYQGNTPEIKALLTKAGKSYRLFKHSLDKNGNAFMVSLTVRQLLKYMNDATNLYSKLK